MISVFAGALAAAQTATQDMKSAGSDTRQAVKHGVHKAADKVAQKTR
jgi:hypothetical protein